MVLRLMQSMLVVVLILVSFVMDIWVAMGEFGQYVLWSEAGAL